MYRFLYEEIPCMDVCPFVTSQNTEVIFKHCDEKCLKPGTLNGGFYERIQCVPTCFKQTEDGTIVELLSCPEGCNTCPATCTDNPDDETLII
jgi:hypothetical protein